VSTLDPAHLGLRDPEVPARAHDHDRVTLFVRVSAPNALTVCQIDRVCARIGRQDNPRERHDDHPDPAHSLSSSLRKQPSASALEPDGHPPESHYRGEGPEHLRRDPPFPIHKRTVHPARSDDTAHQRETTPLSNCPPTRIPAS
jgi:hypothetical protein